ncbi:BRCA1-associated protein 2 domain-containing protein [Hirsutella rhossiliensis]|uniref:BRCA1-associated protein 2 domain-containing protein n=1 Tax=Hirsutella rhossiliensis TaxID=111463 RepID=A0A9P8MM49_9HYPO|nr:BRCA1-associated protein 2 domain-containing protein [Hirsutella rhossiliensis]KAH0958753.1 BRCA1-associated protein 2 domain-containing protein [Hirsutella rhossiliensis]
MPGETSKAGPSAAPTLGPSFGGAGTATKAKFLPRETKNTELGWGVVHFYRDGQESPLLDAPQPGEDGPEREDTSTADACSTLCIPAVPAYMTPGDFMGFLGDRWTGDISHCRMVMTSSMNRYLVLLKFRDGGRAKHWRREFDGKVFNSMESQVCHVVFVKSITFETPTRPRRNDQSVASSSSAVSNSLKPFPPPPPNLIELPTCPNWKGAGCPVCRFTNTSSEVGSSDADNPYSQPFGSSASNLCSVCDCTDDLWICLICGYVGCGRYKGGHAKDHWKETAHSFALELETQHVWDYAGDMWVHRLIRDKGDGKVVELPGRSSHSGQREDEDVVPRAKLENIGLEYTHLITSQLESQRAYYEEMISKAVDKAAKASAVAESSAAQSSETMARLTSLEEKHRVLSMDTVPHLERDLEREKKKAGKAEGLARSLGKSLQEEKRVNEGLMKRIEHLGADNETVRKQLDALREENAELKEMNRDLSMFISGQEKLQELEREGKVEEGELAEGSMSVPEKKGRRRPRKN